MFESVLTWITRVSTDFNISPERVLDVGSKDHNMKAGARDCFPDSEYIGVDIVSGHNVDILGDVYELDARFENGSFDVVLCLHLLEHLARPWLAMEQITDVLAPNGYLYLSMPTLGFPRHNYPGDYWRATDTAISEVLMDGYKILSIENDTSKFSRHPFINCLGAKE